MKAVLGLDIGTSSAKAVFVSVEGAILASASSPVSADSPRPGYLEEAPQDWWKAVSSALAAARARAPGSLEIQAIGLSGHMSGLVLLDRDGEPVMPCILLADTRGSQEADALPPDLRARIIQQSGNAPSAVFTLAKLMWVREHDGSAWKRAAHAVSPKDYLLSRLTGVVSTEPTDAGNYLLLDASASCWDLELMERLGLRQDLFPPLRSSSAPAGEVSAAAARELGLPRGLPVVAGAADMACTAVGSAVLAEGDAAISLGTASPVIMPISGIERDLVGRFTFHPHVTPGSRYALASILSGGRSYQWLTGIMRDGGAREIDYPSLDGIASQAGAGSDGVLFLPFLTGRASPDWRPAARAAWVGLGAASSLPQLARSVLEAVAYNCRECIQLSSRRRKAVRRVVVSGGGSKSRLWLGIIADVTGLPVQALAMPEASALGAAVLAGAGSGAYPSISDALAGMVRLGELIQPDGKRAAMYGRYYESWLLAKSRLEAVDDALASAREGGTA